jgi:PAS domain S-box-containing protein
MAEILKDKKREVVKNIIKRLNKDLTFEEAKELLLKEVGSITSYEIAEVEQSLINEGWSIDEIKKFCNVHALLFESTLKQKMVETSEFHPVNLFKLENRGIEKLTKTLKELNEIEKIKDTLLQLKAIDIHYTRKEQLLFPFLEKAGFYGPSKVMWGKDNDIREMLKKAIENVDKVELTEFRKNYLNNLIEEIESMIFKEENILFPTSLEKLKPEDWVEILKQSNTIGYCFITPPSDLESMIEDLEKNIVETAVYKDGVIKFPSGELSLDELLNILNGLPIDISFVDKDEKVKYFSETKDRIFFRPRTIIGRDVRNCHPPQSVDKVEKIINDFKEKKRDVAEFWINFKGRFIHIRYFAIRNKLGEYLGTLEVTQDITNIKKLEGERRLLDEGN